MIGLTGKICGVETKRCTQCRHEKPVVAFGAQRLGKNGLKAACRACEAKWMRARREKQPALQRMCIVCKERKPDDDFSRNGRGELRKLCECCWKGVSEKRRATRDTPGTRLCNACGVEKPNREFWRSSISRTGLMANCADCTAATNRNSHATSKGRGKHRARHLQICFGITVEQYNELLADQSGGCGICGRTAAEVDPRQELAVDHCHKTGKVRGILCKHCNFAIGRLGDDIDGLLRALTYLRKAQERT